MTTNNSIDDGSPIKTDMAEYFDGSVIDIRGNPVCVDTGRRLSECTFEGRNFAGIDFSRAILDGAIFRKCNFSNCSFDGATISNCVFAYCDCRATSFDGVKFGNSSLFESALRRCSLRDARVINSDFGNVRFLNTESTAADFVLRSTDPHFEDSWAELVDESDRASAVDARGSKWAGVSFVGSHLGWAMMDDTVIVGADFEGACLIGASFRNAVLIDSYLAQATMKNPVSFRMWFRDEWQQSLDWDDILSDGESSLDRLSVDFTGLRTNADEMIGDSPQMMWPPDFRVHPSGVTREDFFWWEQD